MIIDIYEASKTYTINFERITQFLGKNVILKKHVMDIIKKYFSSEKYDEWENIPKIKLCDEELGRKYYTTYNISCRNDLIDYIRNLKAGMIVRLIKISMNEYSYQTAMKIIDDELTSIFLDLERNILRDIGNISVGYNCENLINIIQKSYIETREGKALEQLNNYELFNIFLNTLHRLQEYEPTKVLVCVKDIDHLLESDKYNTLCQKIEEISKITDTWFIISASLDGYCVVDKDMIEGINVFNELVYSVPDLEHLKEYLEDNYPFNVVLEEKKLLNILKYAIPYIGVAEPFLTYDVMTSIKIVNDTLEIKNSLDKPANVLSLAFLSDKNMI